MGRAGGIVSSLLPLILTAGCDGRGERIDLDHGAIYHTPAVEPETARRLGAYLSDARFFSDAIPFVQLDRARDSPTGTYIFRIALRNAENVDSTTVRAARSIGLPISREVLGEIPVRVELCDEDLNPIRIFPPPDFGKKVHLKGGDVYYLPPATEAEARATAEFLVGIRVFDGRPRSVQIARSTAGIILKAVVGREAADDPGTTRAFRTIGEGISQKVFAGTPVEVHLCDANLETLRPLPPSGGAPDRRNR